MFKQIYKTIKKYNKIVIARHVGVDPDAMASQIALRDSIKLSFPEKKVYAIGVSSNRFSYIGKLDKIDDIGTLDDTLLIVVDTPDIKRIDGAVPSDFNYVIKIDHHPFIENFGGLEYIKDSASSAAEIIMSLIDETKLSCNADIAKTLYYGLVSDSNRFLYESSTSETFSLVSKYLEKYPFNTGEVYRNLYMRPLSEVRLKGYISTNMIITDNGVGYVDITDELQKKLKVDSASPGNMVNDFNFIEEILVWATITEDVKNGQIRISIRSRGPEINKIAEKHGGGGHKFASGVKTENFEEAHNIMNELDKACSKYLKENKLGE